MRLTTEDLDEKFNNLEDFMESSKRGVGLDATRMQIDFDQLGLTLSANQKQVLKDVTGHAGSGSLLAVMGASGAGKSTFVRVLMGKAKATSGTISINGTPKNMSDFKKIIGYSISVLQKHGVDYISKNLQILFALELNYNIAHLTIKTSILLFYRTIFTFVIVPFKRAWYFIFAYVIANAIASFIIVFAQCQPLRYAWDEPKGLEGKCVDLKANEISSGVIIALADFMLLVLPVPVLWSLHVSKRDKMMLCGLFALGSFALIASIIRVTYLGKVVSSVDFTFVMLDGLIWSIVEVNVGIICACIPTLKPLLSRKPKATSMISYSANSRNTTAINSKKYESKNTTSSISLDEYPLAEAQGPTGISPSSVAKGSENSRGEELLDFITTKAI